MNKEFLHMQKLAGIITEGEYREKLEEKMEYEDRITEENVYSVYVNTDDRFDRNFLVRAGSEQEAQNLALKDEDIGWDEEVTNVASRPIDQDFLDTWEEEEFFIGFMNDPSLKIYLYDSGT